jgi:hypothetical protein
MKNGTHRHVLLLMALLCVLPACSDNGEKPRMDLSGESIGQDTEDEEKEGEEEQEEGEGQEEGKEGKD